MSGGREGDAYAPFEEYEPFYERPSWRERHQDDVEPWWERFYDERDDYEPIDEVER